MSKEMEHMDNGEIYSALGMHTVGGFLVVPVNAELNDDYAQGLQKAVLQKVKDTGVKGVLFDVSVLSIFDAFSFSVLADTARMVRMLGADMVFVGFQPGVASALIDLGLEIKDLQTVLTMDDGFAFLRNRTMGRFGTGKPEAGAIL